jgi:hypothetical protein
MKKIVVVVLAVSCVGAAAASSGRNAASKPAAVYAFLADNTIVRTNAVFGTWKVARLGKPPPDIISTGGLLARSRDHRIVWALVRSESTLAALTPDLRTLKMISLPKSWSTRALAVGRFAGRGFPRPQRGVADRPKTIRQSRPSGRSVARRPASASTQPMVRRCLLLARAACTLAIPLGCGADRAAVDDGLPLS